MTDFSWMHKRVGPHSCQTCKNSMTACDKSAGSNSNAGLNQYIPMVSNRHRFSDDGFRVRFWLRAFQFASILWRLFSVCGVFTPVRSLWHTRMHLKGESTLCSVVPSKIGGLCWTKDHRMLLWLKMSQQYWTLIMPLNQPALLEQLRATR